MANELQSLSMIFQNRLFRIPDYQRGYAWQQSQLIDFWDDIVNLQEDRYHYTGLLSLKPLRRKEIGGWGKDLWMVDKGYLPCHVVDGQQRLTTFIILLNELINFIQTLPEFRQDPNGIVLGYDRLEEIRAKYICQKRPPNNEITTYLFSYENDNPSAEYMRYKIFCEPFGGAVKETYYTKNLKFARQFFWENIKELYSAEGFDGLNSLYRKMTQHLMFNIHEIDDDYDVFVAFETMNNRGKKLTNLELLKNRLIYLTTLYPDNVFDSLDKDHLRNEINDAWKEVYYQLGKNNSQPLQDDEYLRAHWIIFFAYSRNKGDDYIRYLLSRFSAKNIFEKETVVPDAQDSIPLMMDSEEEAMDDSADLSDEEMVTLQSRLMPKEISNYVHSLKELAKYWYDTFFPNENPDLTAEEKQCIDRLNRIGISYFRPLVAAMLSKPRDGSNSRVEALKAIERFLFIAFRIGGYNQNWLNSEYYKAARSIYLGETDEAEIAKGLNKRSDSEVDYATKNFAAKVEKWFANGKGFYDWPTLKYFLFEYEQSLFDKFGIKKIASWEMFTQREDKKVSIEHILPQTPTKYYWRNIFRQYTDAEITQLSGALGNLLPLSLSINVALQNDSFEDKKHAKSTGRRGYDNGSHSELEVAKLPDWTAQTIYERTMKLIGFMEQRWEMSLSESRKDAIAFITFARDKREYVPEIPTETLAITENEDDGKERPLSFIAEVHVEWCEEQRAKGRIHFDRSHSNNEYIRFTTDTMDSILPEQEIATSGWGNHHFYFYEIHNSILRRMR